MLRWKRGAHTPPIDADKQKQPDDVDKMPVPAQQFDAALVDLSPIAHDVGGALTHLSNCSPRARVVVISGSAAEVPASALSMMCAWVRKPFEVGEILTILRNLPRSPA